MTNSNAQAFQRWDHRDNHAGDHQFLVRSSKRLRKGTQVLAQLNSQEQVLVWIGKPAQCFDAGYYAHFARPVWAGRHV